MGRLFICDSCGKETRLPIKARSSDPYGSNDENELRVQECDHTALPESPGIKIKLLIKNHSIAVTEYSVFEFCSIACLLSWLNMQHIPEQRMDEDQGGDKDGKALRISADAAGGA